jgi:hypothetical protein
VCGADFVLSLMLLLTCFVCVPLELCSAEVVSVFQTGRPVLTVMDAYSISIM